MLQTKTNQLVFSFDLFSLSFIDNFANRNTPNYPPARPTKADTVQPPHPHHQPPLSSPPLPPIADCRIDQPPRLSGKGLLPKGHHKVGSARLYIFLFFNARQIVGFDPDFNE